MQVTLKGEPIEIAVTSVILDTIDGDNRLNMFHCYRCRFQVAQYTNDVVHIGPGLISNNYPVIEMCKNCKKKYVFQGVARLM